MGVWISLEQRNGLTLMYMRDGRDHWQAFNEAVDVGGTEYWQTVDMCRGHYEPDRHRKHNVDNLPTVAEARALLEGE